jgi:hypothetical protein
MWHKYGTNMAQNKLEGEYGNFWSSQAFGFAFPCFEITKLSFKDFFISFNLTIAFLIIMLLPRKLREYNGKKMP